MKKFLAVVFFVIIGVACFFLFGPSHPGMGNPADASAPSENSATGSLPAAAITTPSLSIPFTNGNPAPNPAAAQVAVAPGTTNSPAAPATEAPSLAPLTILDNARVAIHNYQDRFGENPVGNNSEITAALMGKNPKQVNFITPESGLRVNDQGEMIDAWGTPFFFHALSGKNMEIRSAGEDRKMWTFDDIVTR